VSSASPWPATRRQFTSVGRCSSRRCPKPSVRREREGSDGSRTAASGYGSCATTATTFLPCGSTSTTWPSTIAVSSPLVCGINSAIVAGTGASPTPSGMSYDPRCNCNAAIVSQCPVPKSCHHRAVAIRTGAGNAPGPISSAPEPRSRSGTWRQYRASSVGSCTRPFDDNAGSAFDVGIRFEIEIEVACEEMIGAITRQPVTVAV